MAGHSHWAGIKHRKGAQDKKRGKLFSKLSKAIIIAAREGGGDPEANLKLRYAIDKARASNMPKDVIERAIKKGTGDIEGVTYDDILYEGYGPGGVAVMVEVLTDNRNRTAPEMRKLFSDSGGNLANPGAVAFMFDRKGLIVIPAEGLDFDEVFMAAAEAGAENAEQEEGMIVITTDPSSFMDVSKAVEAQGWTTDTAEVAWLPQNMANPPEDVIEKVEALLEKLDDHDDVQNVYSNYEPAGE
ncbi:MAG TPA: YebC/PmpR family DNA-binding transcriptional regulator [Planctomycetes bacterium]|nr:YebC/PmpR family DNA-binding transcriptional regulator [Planctomycetota bacterium]